MGKHTTAADTRMVALGNALREVAELVRHDDIKAVLGASYTNEIVTVAAGFRQRFPLHFSGINPRDGE